MIIREIIEQEKDEYNQKISHIIQSYEWGRFRERTGVDLFRLGSFDEKGTLDQGFQLTLHPVPHTSFTIGYFPKSPLPTSAMLQSIEKIALEHDTIFVKIEPLIQKDSKEAIMLDQLTREDPRFIKSKKDVFAPHTFFLDLKKSEDELLAQMHQKTRYNIGLAQRKGVRIYLSDKGRDFAAFLLLQKETAKRNGFYLHPDEYYRTLWEVLQPEGIAHLLMAKYQEKTLGAWILFTFKNTLYYPYGASSSLHREFMVSNLLMWEAIRFGKKKNCTVFDMWGSLGQDADPRDPWYGFHRFKQGYGGEIVTFVGAYDFIIQPRLYQLSLLADKLRWAKLHLSAQIRRMFP